MPKTVLHVKCIMCTSVSIGNQAAKLGEPLKEGLKKFQAQSGGKNKSCLKLISLAGVQLKQMSYLVFLLI